MLPALFHILQYLESKHEKGAQPGHCDRLFSMLPLKQGFKTQNVKLDITSLYQLMRRSAEGRQLPAAFSTLPGSLGAFMKDRNQREQWWGKVFCLEKIRKLRPAWKFANQIVTDAYAISLIFERPQPACTTESDAAVGAAAATLPASARLSDFRKVCMLLSIGISSMTASSTSHNLCCLLF